MRGELAVAGDADLIHSAQPEFYTWSRTALQHQTTIVQSPSSLNMFFLRVLHRDKIRLRVVVVIGFSGHSAVTAW